MSQLPILMVEDDKTFQGLLRFALDREGLGVVITDHAKDMYRQIEQREFSLILLDLGLPDEDGLVLLRQLRSRLSTPIIVMTGRDDPDVAVTALELGADDFVTKPFDPRAVVLRIKRMISRSQSGKAEKAPGTIRFNGWKLSVAGRCLYNQENQEIVITRSEFQVLMSFLAHPGLALTRDRLLDALSRTDTPGPRTIDVLVLQLRKKLETDWRNPQLIKSVHGIGYRFDGRIE